MNNKPYNPTDLDTLLEGDLTSGVETLTGREIVPFYQRLHDVGELSARYVQARSAYEAGLKIAKTGRFDPRRIYHAIVSRNDCFKDLPIEGMLEVLTKTLAHTQETVCTLIPQAQEALRAARDYEVELAECLVLAHAHYPPCREELATKEVGVRKALSTPCKDVASLAEHRRSKIVARQDCEDARLRVSRLESYLRVRDAQLLRLTPLQEAMQETYRFLVSARDSLQLEQEYITHNASAMVLSDHMVRNSDAYQTLFAGTRAGIFRLDELSVQAKSTINLLGKALYGR
ncbi:hypothetical protein HY641_01630 [Candidatus Woesearchaeota archaeon]|nr:hypothetical protein [Candidatus Woesearchaeota archaeon]